MFSLISKYNLIWKMALFLGHGENSNYFKIDSSGLGPVSLVDLGAEKIDKRSYKPKFWLNYRTYPR